jgi:hypothetical protein
MTQKTPQKWSILKMSSKCFAAKYNVAIKYICSDYGAYASARFKLSCEKDNQDLAFCSVGGHWQNFVAEHHIGVMSQAARTILLHGMANCPGIITAEFCPIAIRHACTFHNSSVQTDTNCSPHHMFTGSLAPWCLKDFCVFGCPVFALDKRL